MARAGLAPASVTEAGAALADEVGFDRLSMGLLAERLGVKTPSLYKHVDGQADLAHRIAVLGANELADAVRDATQGRSGRDALAAVLRGYRVDPAQEVHALRMLRSVLHGFATLEVSGGFRLDTDVDESFDWVVALVDRGLSSLGVSAPSRP